MSAPFSIGTRILGGGAAVLLLFLAVGFLLPGTWSAERSAVMSVPPSAIFPLLDSPEGWRRWTPWPDSGLVAAGPARGPGSRMEWSSRDLGDGFFEIVDIRDDVSVTYHVEVQGGAMRTEGRIDLEEVPEGTRVTWLEEGDFGPNPLMGYWARFMDGAQEAEMEKGLVRLEKAAGEEATGTAPPGSMPEGAASRGPSDPGVRPAVWPR
ncbi:MAG: SRPBCC family protein [Gemmatimonadota bacterium]